MSIFPTKILLATDGSEEAEMAAKTAVGLVQQTGSELHIIHVLASPIRPLRPEPSRRCWKRGTKGTTSWLSAAPPGAPSAPCWLGTP